MPVCTWCPLLWVQGTWFFSVLFSKLTVLGKAIRRIKYGWQKTRRQYLQLIGGIILAVYIPIVIDIKYPPSSYQSSKSSSYPDGALQSFWKVFLLHHQGIPSSWWGHTPLPADSSQSWLEVKLSIPSLPSTHFPAPPSSGFFHLRNYANVWSFSFLWALGDLPGKQIVLETRDTLSTKCMWPRGARVLFLCQSLVPLVPLPAHTAHLLPFSLFNPQSSDFLTTVWWDGSAF